MKSASSGEGRSGFDYLAEYIWQMLLDFLVGEAQDANTALYQKLGALGIVYGPFRVKVNVTIDFNSQLILDAKQVENELSVGMLSSKFETGQLPVA